MGQMVLQMVPPRVHPALVWCWPPLAPQHWLPWSSALHSVPSWQAAGRQTTPTLIAAPLPRSTSKATTSSLASTFKHMVLNQKKQIEGALAPHLAKGLVRPDQALHQALCLDLRVLLFDDIVFHFLFILKKQRHKKKKKKKKKKS